LDAVISADRHAEKDAEKIAKNALSTGNIRESFEEVKRVYELDPLSFHFMSSFYNDAMVCGKMSLSYELLDRAKRANPGNPRVYVSFANRYLRNGDIKRATQMIEIAKSARNDEPFAPIFESIIRAISGRYDNAEGTLLKRNISVGARNHGLIYVYTIEGKIDDAFKILMRSIERHSFPYLTFIDPLLEDLRNDTRFVDFETKNGWRKVSPT
jgi:tetratricopeptide (TPR) repeat protein